MSVSLFTIGDARQAIQGIRYRNGYCTATGDVLQEAQNIYNTSMQGLKFIHQQQILIQDVPLIDLFSFKPEE
jgi:hypothetical protein